MGENWMFLEVEARMRRQEMQVLAAAARRAAPIEADLEDPGFVRLLVDRLRSLRPSQELRALRELSDRA